MREWTGPWPPCNRRKRSPYVRRGSYDRGSPRRGPPERQPYSSRRYDFDEPRYYGDRDDRCYGKRYAYRSPSPPGSHRRRQAPYGHYAKPPDVPPPRHAGASPPFVRSQRPPLAQKIEDGRAGHLEWEPGLYLRSNLKVVSELGTGTFGRVLECYDEDRQEMVAVKVVRNGPEYTEAAEYEAEVLRVIGKHDPEGKKNCIKLFDWFMHHHSHMCLVTEKLGLSLYEFLDKNRMRPFTLKHIQTIAKDILDCLVFLKEIGLTHTDLKLENVLLVDSKMPEGVALRSDNTWRDYQVPQNAHVKIADFGGATFARDEHSPLINTRQYRAPEVILNLGWNESSDMWSFGCILFELYTGRLLFRTHDHLEHLHLIEQFIGRIPSHMLKRASNTRGSEYVKRFGQQKCYLRPLEERWLAGRRSLVAQLDCGLDEFNAFVAKTLTVDPDRRPTPREMLEHPFLQLHLP